MMCTFDWPFWIAVWVASFFGGYVAVDQWENYKIGKRMREVMKRIGETGWKS